MIVPYSVVAALSFILDIAFFLFFHSNDLGIYESSFYARLITATFNFYANKVWVFKKPSAENLFTEIYRYVVSATCAIVLSAVLLDLINENHSVLLAFYKFIIDSVIFVTGFLLQRFWVFRNDW